MFDVHKGWKLLIQTRTKTKHCSSRLDKKLSPLVDIKHDRVYCLLLKNISKIRYRRSNQEWELKLTLPSAGAFWVRLTLVFSGPLAMLFCKRMFKIELFLIFIKFKIYFNYLTNCLLISDRNGLRKCSQQKSNKDHLSNHLWNKC